MIYTTADKHNAQNGPIALFMFCHHRGFWNCVFQRWFPHLCILVSGKFSIYGDHFSAFRLANSILLSEGGSKDSCINRFSQVSLAYSYTQSFSKLDEMAKQQKEQVKNWWENWEGCMISWHSDNETWLFCSLYMHTSTYLSLVCPYTFCVSNQESYIHHNTSVQSESRLFHNKAVDTKLFCWDRCCNKVSSTAGCLSACWLSGVEAGCILSCQ